MEHSKVRPGRSCNSVPFALIAVCPSRLSELETVLARLAKPWSAVLLISRILHDIMQVFLHESNEDCTNEEQGAPAIVSYWPRTLGSHSTFSHRQSVH